MSIQTYGDASGGPRGEPQGGATIQAGGSVQVRAPFTWSDSRLLGDASTLRSVHVEPSGTDFLVSDDDVVKKGTPFSYPTYDVTIPESACPVTPSTQH